MNDKIAIGYWYCINSKRRYRIVMALGEKAYLTPTVISKKTSIPTSHISVLLKDLQKNGIVVCINEEVKKGKLFKLTDFGYSLLPFLNGDKSIS